MTRVQSADAEELRVIMCVAFDHRAPFEEVNRFKECLINCVHAVRSLQLTGTYDLMVEATFRNIVEYQEKLEGIADISARLIARYEANFVCKRFVREKGRDKAIWVPCHRGLQRVDCSKIDKIEAEGDYMRIHSGAQTWLMHTTMRDLQAKLSPDEFVCIHRSTTLRRDYIECILHEGKRWVARLRNGERKYVAKSHVKEVLVALGIEHAPTPAIPDLRGDE